MGKDRIYKLRVTETPITTRKDRRAYDAYKKAHAAQPGQQLPNPLVPRYYEIVLPESAQRARGKLNKLNESEKAALVGQVQEAKRFLVGRVEEVRREVGLPPQPDGKRGRVVDLSRELIQRVEVNPNKVDAKTGRPVEKVTDAREAIATLNAKAEKRAALARAEAAKREAAQRAEAARKQAEVSRVQKAEARKTVKAAVKDSTKAARQSEEGWHKQLVKAGEEKRYFIDGLGVAARWDDGIIFSLRKNPRQHLVERHIDADASSRDITDRFSQMLQQSRKYELDPQNIYESGVEKLLESVDKVKSAKGKKTLGGKFVGWLGGEAFNRVPGLQGIHAAIQYAAKLGSPDSTRSKWGELKHDMVLNGPVETIAALPVIGAPLAAFIFGTGGLGGVPAALWAGGSFLYSQVYTPGKMEPAFDRVDKQIRYGSLGAEERLFDIQAGANQALATIQQTHAAGLVNAFTTEIKHKHAPTTSELAVAKPGRLQKGVERLAEVGRTLDDKKKGTELGLQWRERVLHGRRTEAAKAQLPAAPEAPKEPTLAEKAALAQKTAPSHLKWVEAILDYAPQMIVATSGADQTLWKQSLAYAEEQMRVYQKAAQLVQPRA